ncbi:MAG: signal recognition particle protein, partial [Cytophagales bacterium]|nr:signal recognition particle protein [Cytophagales bacterium]
SSKLGLWVKKKGISPLLVGCDVYRPAAAEQLRLMGEKAGVAVYTEEEQKDPVQIAQHALNYAAEHQHKTLIVDTAGRLSVDENLMKELRSLKEILKPQESLFVVDSMTGQDAVRTAQSFQQQVDYEGVVLTKLDGDTRGGAALSIRNSVDKPIKFVSVGERVEALELFYPDRMARRILGMGDVLSFVEKAQENYEDKEIRRLSKKIHTNRFDLNDFLTQVQKMRKIGSAKEILDMLPGNMKKSIPSSDLIENNLKNVETIVSSMTPTERKEPKILDRSRKQRIAKGSGTSLQQVNGLLKQYEMAKKAMKNPSANWKTFFSNQ